jgi:3D (Asp-Asp-Asp) domain-containing protein
MNAKVKSRESLCRGAIYILLGGVMATFSSCMSPAVGAPPIRVPSQRAHAQARVEVTGYCACQDCCGWRRNWRGRPVSVRTGAPKQVGVTASGTRARVGTIAADTRVLPFGTTLYVPGYGYGRVEDRGSAITGNRLDLYFDTHAEALRWGRRQEQALIWWTAGRPTSVRKSPPPARPGTGPRSSASGSRP